MTNWPILAQSHDALRAAVAAVTDWDAPTPCSDWTAAQVLQHAAGDQIGFAAFLTGGPGPSFDPFSPSGTLDGTPGDLLEPALKLAAEAWAGVATSYEKVRVPVPPNDMPAGLGVGACALDAAVHAWDLAKSAGAPTPLPTTLARDLLPVAQQIVEPLRAFGAYATALPATSGDEVASLMRYLGRDPHWTP
ncbi:maleylpyruvate isomerase family mycothiol-dependent enzyme [Actinomadura oligospora]|uniref:maleylpyruvate isomerase family mycothiol-dependent enzyme n=1 Tax=Actinomadura oligospora TaxID=111804 RepID=UPI00047BB5DC|nr:maleylpyruvate isomerase family mycothiol-dependent enzyme [Actinomadura oligospora]